MYTSLLNFILNEVPELRNNLERIHLDYERAAMKAVRDVLPNVEIAGCFFHYVQVSFLTAPKTY